MNNRILASLTLVSLFSSSAFGLNMQERIIVERSGEKMKDGDVVIVEVKKRGVLVNGQTLTEYNKNGIQILIEKKGREERTCPSCKKHREKGHRDDNREKPYLGVLSESVDGLRGAVVRMVVPHSGAQVGGLEVGDVLTRINGTEVDSQKDLMCVIGEMVVGDSVNIAYTRNGSSHETKAVLKSWKPDQWGKNDSSLSTFMKERMKAHFPQNRRANDWGGRDDKPFHFGMEVEVVKEGQSSGLKVVEVIEGSQACQMGLEVGDVITKVDDLRVSDNFAKAIAALRTLPLKNAHEVVIEVKRKEITQTLKIPIHAKRISI